MLGASAVDEPDIEASPVLRQIRSLPWAWVTVIGEAAVLTMYMVPVRPFSGLLPPGAAAKRGSRKVAVCSEDGSNGAFSQVSL